MTRLLMASLSVLLVSACGHAQLANADKTHVHCTIALSTQSKIAGSAGDRHRARELAARGIWEVSQMNAGPGTPEVKEEAENFADQLIKNPATLTSTIGECSSDEDANTSYTQARDILMVQAARFVDQSSTS